MPLSSCRGPQHPGQSSVRIGFVLRADQWGKGLGTDVVRLLLRLSFDELD
ncbi:GNAT family N-acetyltransferase [Streptosporangium subroseum]